MLLTLFQIILITAGVAALAAGVVLLGRELHLPGFKQLPPPVGKLSYWTVSGVEFAILVVFVLLIGATLQAVAVSVFGEMILASPERRGLEVAILGLALHCGGLLAWPLFAFYRRFLFANYQTTPPADPARLPRLTWGEVLRTGAGTYLIAIPLVLLVSKTWQQSLEFLGFPANQQDTVVIFHATRDPLILVGMYLVACVIGPINEELLFRRGLFHFIRQRTGRRVAVGLSALCFGAIHFNLLSFLPLTLLGAILAIAYERSGDVRAPIVAHSLFNLTTLLLLQAGLSAE